MLRLERRGRSPGPAHVPHQARGREESGVDGGAFRRARRPSPPRARRCRGPLARDPEGKPPSPRRIVLAGDRRVRRAAGCLARDGTLVALVFTMPRRRPNPGIHCARNPQQAGRHQPTATSKRLATTGRNRPCRGAVLARGGGDRRSPRGAHGHPPRHGPAGVGRPDIRYGRWHGAQPFRRPLQAGRHPRIPGPAQSPRRAGVRWHEIRHLRRADVQGLCNRLVAEGASPSTVRNAIMPLRVLYRRALRAGQVTMSPLEHLELPAVRGVRDRVASPEEAGSLLAALPAGVERSGRRPCTPACDSAN
jgi:hypothetical protein